MNSLLGTALDGPQTGAGNPPRLQSSGSSLLGACPQPLIDEQQLRQYSQRFNQSQYGQTLPSLLSDFERNLGKSNDYRSSSLLGSLRNDFNPNSRQNYNQNSLASSSSILGSVNAVQDTFHLQQATQMPRSSHAGIPSLLGPIQPPSNPPQRFFRNADVQGSVSGTGIPSLLGSLTSNPKDDSPQQISRIPSLVEPTGKSRMSDGPRTNHNFGAVGGSILGSANSGNDRDSLVNPSNNQNQSQNSGSNQIPSLLGSLSSLPLMGGQQNNQRGMNMNHMSGPTNPVPLFRDEVDLVGDDWLDRGRSVSALNEEQLFAGGQQQMQQLQQMQRMQQLQQQLREPQLQQHQHSAHMESQMRGGNPGFSMAPGGYSMTGSAFSSDNPMSGDVFSLNENNFSVPGNNFPMEPSSSYSMSANNGYSMAPNSAYSMAANGMYSMDNGNNMGTGGGNGMRMSETRCSVLMMNLPIHLGPDDLKTTLYNCCLSGPPIDVQVPWAGVARLLFNNAQSAVALVNQMDGQNLNGHVLRVYIESYNTDSQRME